MKVETVMSRSVRSCMPDHTLACAAQLMWEGDCGCVPIVDGGGYVKGMITDRDICMATYLNGRTPQDLRVGDFMSRYVLACGPHDRIADATATMRRAQVRSSLWRTPRADSSGSFRSRTSRRACQPDSSVDGSTMLDVGRTLGARRTDPRAAGRAERMSE
jgi:predicted transcriptional regulator